MIVFRNYIVKVEEYYIIVDKQLKRAVFDQNAELDYWQVKNLHIMTAKEMQKTEEDLSLR